MISLVCPVIGYRMCNMYLIILTYRGFCDNLACYGILRGDKNQVGMCGNIQLAQYHLSVLMENRKFHWARDNDLENILDINNFYKV